MLRLRKMQRELRCSSSSEASRKVRFDSKNSFRRAERERAEKKREKKSEPFLSFRSFCGFSLFLAFFLLLFPLLLLHSSISFTFPSSYFSSLCSLFASPSLPLPCLPFASPSFAFSSLPFPSSCLFSSYRIYYTYSILFRRRRRRWRSKHRNGGAILSRRPTKSKCGSLRENE